MLYLDQTKNLVDEYWKKILMPVRNSPKNIIEDSKSKVASVPTSLEKKDQIKIMKLLKDFAIKNLKNH